MTDEATRPLHAQLVAISRAAHAAGQHEVAYHSLMAALHAARDAEDVDGIAESVHEAREQIAWIDAHRPEHRLSTASAGKHNHPGVFEMLARQGETYLEILHREPRRVTS